VACSEIGFVRAIRQNYEDAAGEYIQENKVRKGRTLRQR
jgi:hypothetical protein